MIKLSYMKSIISEFIELSKKLDRKINYNSLNKIEEISREIVKISTSDKFHYRDLYKFDNSIVPSSTKLDGLGFYEFNIDGFVYIIIRRNNEFYIINYKEGNVRLVNRFYRFGIGRNKITNYNIFEGSLINDSAFSVIDEVNNISDGLYVSSIMSILYDIVNDTDLIFTYLENTYVDIDDDILNPKIGGKTGLFIPSKLIHSDFLSNMARHSFVG